MRVVDILVGITGLIVLAAALLFVKSRQDQIPVLKRPSGVPTDAGYYEASDEWIRCLNTNDSRVFECEIYSNLSGELVNKGSYIAPTDPTLPLIIQGSRNKDIAVRDQRGQSFSLKSQTGVR